MSPLLATKRTCCDEAPMSARRTTPSIRSNLVFRSDTTTILYYLMCLILTPLVYLWVKDIHLLLLAFAVYGFFIQGCFSWTPIWLPELFPTRMRATTAGFIFNAPRLISAIAPLIAGTLIVGLGGYGKAATIIGMFYILGLIAVPFLPETRGKPLPEADTLALGEDGPAQGSLA